MSDNNKPSIDMENSTMVAMLIIVSIGTSIFLAILYNLFI